MTQGKYRGEVWNALAVAFLSYLEVTMNVEEGFIAS